MARRRFLKVGIIQSLVIVALTLTFHRSGNEALDATQRDSRQAEKAARAERFAQAMEARHAAAKDAPAPSFKEEMARFKEDVKGADSRKPEAAKPEAEPQGIWGAISRQFAFWAALFAALQVAQWVVIALSRDFHDAISRDASLLTGVEPEDPPIQPRVRLDVKWLRKKFSRRMRALKMVLVGMPLIYAFVAPAPFRHELLSVLATLWSGYWWVVFTTAKSAYAWNDNDAREPWFLRGWTFLTTRVPGFRWGLLQRYGMFWARQTRDVFSPASELEKQPWAFSGLALTRVVSMVPLVKCFLRPLIPVACAHLIAARNAADRAAHPEAPAPPAQPPAASATAA